jgi:hypothetical protein
MVHGFKLIFDLPAKELFCDVGNRITKVSKRSAERAKYFSVPLWFGEFGA